MIDELMAEPMRRLNRMMQDRAEGSRATWISEILDIADQWRPDGYRRACNKLGDYYNGQ